MNFQVQLKIYIIQVNYNFIFSVRITYNIIIFYVTTLSNKQLLQQKV